MEANTIGLAEYYEVTDSMPIMVEPAERKKGRRPTRARTQALYVRHNDLLDIEPVKFGCCCWRCREGGVAVSDMGALDQILARHLALRMSEVERDAWLREWSVNPKHGPREQQRLATWMAIEKGAKVSAPTYSARAGL